MHSSRSNLVIIDNSEVLEVRVKQDISSDAQRYRLYFESESLFCVVFALAIPFFRLLAAVQPLKLGQLFRSGCVQFADAIILIT